MRPAAMDSPAGILQILRSVARIAQPHKAQQAAGTDSPATSLDRYSFQIRKIAFPLLEDREEACLSGLA